MWSALSEGRISQEEAGVLPGAQQAQAAVGDNMQREGAEEVVEATVGVQECLKHCPLLHPGLQLHASRAAPQPQTHTCAPSVKLAHELVPATKACRKGNWEMH